MEALATALAADGYDTRIDENDSLWLESELGPVVTWLAKRCLNVVLRTRSRVREADRARALMAAALGSREHDMVSVIIDDDGEVVFRSHLIAGEDGAIDLSAFHLVAGALVRAGKALLPVMVEQSESCMAAEVAFNGYAE
jgi:hypothetical protein